MKTEAAWSCTHAMQVRMKWQAATCWFIFDPRRQPGKTRRECTADEKNINSPFLFLYSATAKTQTCILFTSRCIRLVYAKHIDATKRRQKIMANSRKNANRCILLGSAATTGNIANATTTKTKEIKFESEEWGKGPTEISNYYCSWEFFTYSLFFRENQSHLGI